MTELLYCFLKRIGRVLGLWTIRLVAWFIAAGYFFFLPRRLACSVDFYRRLFPQQGLLSALVFSWRQYQDFALVYTERVRLERDPASVSYDSQGEEYLLEASRSGKGAILVMSHVGRWELAARLLAREQQELTIIMGERPVADANQGVKDDIRADGVNVIAVQHGMGSGFEMFDALEALRAGRLVSLTGDRVLQGQRAICVPWEGAQVRVAAAPFALALASGVPLLYVFAVRIGPSRYRIWSLPPRVLAPVRKAQRQQALEAAAAAYYDELVRVVREYPEQWHTFGEFLHQGRSEATGE